jgi:hypothetical protein
VALLDVFLFFVFQSLGLDFIEAFLLSLLFDKFHMPLMLGFVSLDLV